MTYVRSSQKTERQMTMYVSPNFKTKKAFKEAVAAGKEVSYYQPGPFGGNEPRDGTICCEGPHYPEPHKWYAQAVAKNGLVVSVK
jgi:hypothetical protein